MTTTINNEHKKLNVPNLRFPEFEGEWEKCALENLSTEIGDGIHATPLYDDNGIYYFVNGNNISEYGITITPTTQRVTEAEAYRNNANILCSKTILLSINGTIGNVALYKGEPIMLGKSACYINVSTKVNKHYIFHYLMMPKCQFYFTSELTGTTIKNLSLKSVRRTKVSLPNLKEQNRIAQLFDAINERIVTQNKIIDRLQSLIKGINQRVFMNNGINYKLGEVCEIRSGYSGNQLLSKKGLKVSRIETISGHKVNLERVGYVASFESSENYKLQVGDILFSNINSVEYIGNTAFIDKDYDLYHGMNLLRLIPNNMVVIPFYLYLLLNTNRMLNRFKTVCNKAVSQASINQTELGKTVVQIPDINAQKQICELYQALYDKLESEKYANSLFQKQKQYLLRQMFI